MGGLEPSGGRPTRPTLTMELKEWYTPNEVAKLLRVTYMTIKRFEKRGTLVPTKYIVHGKRRDRRYSRETIVEYLGIDLDV